MSEVRLIDANALKRYIPTRMDMQDLYLPAHFRTLIDEQPTVDAVPVTRCEQCKWCEYPAHNSTGYACKLFDRCVKWDWFCADGEMR